jgi:hypothetical protein
VVLVVFSSCLGLGDGEDDRSPAALWTTGHPWGTVPALIKEAQYVQSATSNPACDVRACITQTFRAIYREEGASGFFKGFVPNLLFLMGTYCAGIDEEAETGKPPL